MDEPAVVMNGQPIGPHQEDQLLRDHVPKYSQSVAPVDGSPQPPKLRTRRFHTNTRSPEPSDNGGYHSNSSGRSQHSSNQRSRASPVDRTPLMNVSPSSDSIGYQSPTSVRIISSSHRSDPASHRSNQVDRASSSQVDRDPATQLERLPVDPRAHHRSPSDRVNSHRSNRINSQRDHRSNGSNHLSQRDNRPNISHRSEYASHRSNASHRLNRSHAGPQRTPVSERKPLTVTTDFTIHTQEIRAIAADEARLNEREQEIAEKEAIFQRQADNRRRERELEERHQEILKKHRQKKYQMESGVKYNGTTSVRRFGLSNDIPNFDAMDATTRIHKEMELNRKIKSLIEIHGNRYLDEEILINSLEQKYIAYMAANHDIMIDQSAQFWCEMLNLAFTGIDTLLCAYKINGFLNVYENKKPIYEECIRNIVKSNAVKVQSQPANPWHTLLMTLGISIAIFVVSVIVEKYKGKLAGSVTAKVGGAVSDRILGNHGPPEQRVKTGDKSDIPDPVAKEELPQVMQMAKTAMELKNTKRHRKKKIDSDSSANDGPLFQ